MKTIDRPSQEVAEIERHKYFLSEKAGQDVGWEFAERDWESHYATHFRGAANPEFKPGGLKMLFHRIFSK